LTPPNVQSHICRVIAPYVELVDCWLLEKMTLKESE